MDTSDTFLTVPFHFIKSYQLTSANYLYSGYAMKLSLKRLLCLILLSFMAFIAVSACGRDLHSSNPASREQLTKDCRVVQHMMGEACIPESLHHVITLRPDHFANSFALGIEPIASVFAEGFPFPEDIKNEVGNIESVGGYSTPNLEKILQLKPDLIISNSRLEGIYEDLSRIAPTVVIDLPYPPPSWKEQLQTLAEFMGKEDVSQQLMDDYWQRIENIKQALGPQLDQLEVSVANSSLEHGIWVLGEDHFVGEVLNDIGLQRPLSQRGDFFYIDDISIEKLSNIDGDVLFFVSMGRGQDEEYQEKLQEDSLWQKLNAVQNEQVYFVDGYWQEAGSILAINAVLDDIEKYLIDES